MRLYSWNKSDKYGSVEPGKTADLVLLDADPLLVWITSCLPTIRAQFRRTLIHAPLAVEKRALWEAEDRQLAAKFRQQQYSDPFVPSKWRLPWCVT
jgi:cytosine/adenosine deaminase-related metal-dependent hydrolase